MQNLCSNILPYSPPFFVLLLSYKLRVFMMFISTVLKLLLNAFVSQNIQEKKQVTNLKIHLSSVIITFTSALYFFVWILVTI